VVDLIKRRAHSPDCEHAARVDPGSMRRRSGGGSAARIPPHYAVAARAAAEASRSAARGANMFRHCSTCMQSYSEGKRVGSLGGVLCARK